MTVRQRTAVGLGAVLAASTVLTACQTSGAATFADPPVATPGAAEPGGGPATARPRATPLKGKTIVLDPGHNGGKVLGHQVFVGNGRKSCDTSGTATEAGYSEHAFTWDVALRLRKILKAQGAKVVLTRANDTGSGPCVDERAAIGNRAKADAVISIHADGNTNAKAHGFHVIEPKAVPGYNEAIVAPSRRLGTAVRDAYRKGTGMPYATYLGVNGVTVRDDLGGLNLSKVPKIFIETGNMHHPGDAAKLSDPKFRQRQAVALAAGLTAFLR